MLQRKVFQMAGNKDDLIPSDFPGDLNWTADEAIASLERLYGFVNEVASRAIKWYFSAKKTKRILGYFFRIGALVAVIVSGIIPVFGVIFEKDGIPIISPAWATISLVFAAFFISLDKFGGYTTGWIRYIRTGQALSELQDCFRVDWEKQRFALHEGKTEPEDILQAIDKCKEFLTQVHKTVRAETDQWAQDFRKILQEFEDKTQPAKNNLN